MNPWCHLWSSTNNVDELHAFAARIGMRRTWYQNKPRFPHYDLTGERITLAIKAGAVERDLRQWLAMRDK